MKNGAWIGLVLASLIACGGETLTSPEGSSGAAASDIIGKACTPLEENNPTYFGSSEQEVNIEGPGSPQCGGGVCLSNHFRGRVSCPYGQDPQGHGLGGGPGCKLSDGNEVLTAVPPQCADRTAASAVYCSCRCANVYGRTDDGNPYCACPSGFSCSQIVTSIGAKDDDVSGAYCIKANTEYAPGSACSATCDPSSRPCP